MIRRIVVPLMLVAGLLTTAGCNSGPEMAPVKGVVKFKGQPVTAGTVQLFPVKSGPMAAGRLQEDGAFELTTKEPGDGAYVGDYIVVVTPPSDINDLERVLRPGRPIPIKYEKIPQQVRNQTTSKLRASVQSGQNELEFDLAEIESDS